MMHLLKPEQEETVSLLQKKHLAYIQQPTNDPVSRVDWLNLREVQDDLSYPLPVTFSYLPEVSGNVILRALPDGAETVHKAENGFAEVYNLRIGTAYEWYVKTDEGESGKRIFYTSAQPPRMLFVDGISNVRDIGGFCTADRKYRVRQGLLYRTSEMDCHVSITPEGVRTMEELGIRTDLDLRGIKDEPRGPVLDTGRVGWFNFPLAAYADTFAPEQKPCYRDSFALLTDRANYPIICHCWGGIDRTGTWLYILGAMLGVSEDDLSLDYELSSFSRWNRRSRYSEQFREFLDRFHAYGENPRDAAERFLRDCGVTGEGMNRIRDILLEEI